MCDCFKVSLNAFYDWKSGKSTKRIQREKVLSEKIKTIWEDSSYTYGSPRVWARVMRKYGFRSVHKKKFKVTTDSRHSYPVSENVLNRNFTAERVSQKWVSDLTYIQTKEGWLYLTVIIDLFDRKGVGWSFSSAMTAQETVIPAWRMACQNRPI